MYKIKTKNFGIDSVILSDIEKGNEYLQNYKNRLDIKKWN